MPSLMDFQCRQKMNAFLPLRKSFCNSGGEEASRNLRFPNELEQLHDAGDVGRSILVKLHVQILLERYCVVHYTLHEIANLIVMPERGVH